MSNTNGYPGFGIVEYITNLETSPGIVMYPGQASYFTATNSCTNYLLDINVCSTNSEDTTVIIQPYGSINNSSLSLLGDAATINVSSTGEFIRYQQNQSISLSSGDYIGFIASSSNTNAVLKLSASLWILDS